MAFPLLPPVAAGDILAAMITPAVLISASGTLALSTSNRLARVVDRVRQILDDAEKLPPGETADLDTIEKREIMSVQLDLLAVRMGLLLRTLTTLFIAIGLLVGSSVSIGISASTGEALGHLPAVLGLAGATCLFVAAVLLVWEVKHAVRVSLAEIEYVKRVVARRTGYTETGGPPP